MKRFYDRELEMQRLQEMQRQAYEDYSRFVVLTGRRRVGKSENVYHCPNCGHEWSEKKRTTRLDEVLL